MATLTGNVKEFHDGLAAVVKISVEPLARPVVDRGSVLTYGVKTFRSGPTGNFSLVLAGGDYAVVFPSGVRFTVNVPADDATYAFTDRITSTYITPTGGAFTEVSLATFNAAVAELRAIALAALRPVGDLTALAATQPTAALFVLVTQTIGGEAVNQLWRWNSADTRAGDGATIIRVSGYAYPAAGAWNLSATL